jgi:hypothetical protein
MDKDEEIRRLREIIDQIEPLTGMVEDLKSGLTTAIESMTAILQRIVQRLADVEQVKCPVHGDWKAVEINISPKETENLGDFRIIIAGGCCPAHEKAVGESLQPYLSDSQIDLG